MLFNTGSYFSIAGSDKKINVKNFLNERKRKIAIYQIYKERWKINNKPLEK